MKALLLAAGIGTRLRPITFRTPKCLAPVKGIPVLGHWLHLLEIHGYTEVLINTGYRADQVHAFLENFHTPLGIHIAYEPELLGTGGTIKRNWEFFAGEESFLVAHADNFTNTDLAGLHRFARRRLSWKTPVVVALFHCPRPQECGIVELKRGSRIQRFHEKVENPPGDLANAGIYMCHRSVRDSLDQIPGSKIDFCREVLSQLQGRMFGWPIGDAFLIDIGSPESYQQANLDPRYRLELPANRADVRGLVTLGNSP